MMSLRHGASTDWEPEADLQRERQSSHWSWCWNHRPAWLLPHKPYHCWSSSPQHLGSPGKRSSCSIFPDSSSTCLLHLPAFDLEINLIESRWRKEEREARPEEWGAKKGKEIKEWWAKRKEGAVRREEWWERRQGRRKGRGMMWWNTSDEWSEQGGMRTESL